MHFTARPIHPEILISPVEGRLLKRGNLSEQLEGPTQLLVFLRHFG